MPLDERWYMHPDGHDCPECRYHRQRKKDYEKRANKKISDIEWHQLTTAMDEKESLEDKQRQEERRAILSKMSQVNSPSSNEPLDKQDPTNPVDDKNQVQQPVETKQSSEEMNQHEKPPPTSKGFLNNVVFHVSWVKPLILILSFAIAGVICSRILSSPIIFWLLFSFSLIFAVDRWFHYFTGKSKLIGRLFRLILNCAVLALFGLLIWSTIKLFSHTYHNGPLVDSILLIAEFVFFIWLSKIVAKNSWRSPSLKLTIVCIMGVFLVFAFAGVSPFAGYKDTALDKIASVFPDTTGQNTTLPKTTTSSTNVILTTLSSIFPVITSTPATSTPVSPTTKISTTTYTTSTTLVTTKITGIDPKTGVYKNYYLGLVKESSGATINSYGDFIVLINNRDARNPTYSQLLDFLLADKTDRYPYKAINTSAGSYSGTAESHVDLDSVKLVIDGTKPPYEPRICGDFAEMLHNNAEKAGMRCGFVAIDLAGSEGHALNIFETTDKGIVYIDCTGTSMLYGPTNCDKKVDVQVGQQYIPISLFYEAGWNDTWNSLGTVTNIFSTWDGKWNN